MYYTGLKDTRSVFDTYIRGLHCQEKESIWKEDYMHLISQGNFCYNYFAFNISSNISCLIFILHFFFRGVVGVRGEIIEGYEIHFPLASSL